MEKSNTNTSTDLLNKIKEMLQHQRYAVRRASSIGMSQDEAAEMESKKAKIKVFPAEIEWQVAMFAYDCNLQGS